MSRSQAGHGRAAVSETVPLPMTWFPASLRVVEFLVLPLAFVLAALGAFLLSKITRAVILRLARRTTQQWDEQLAERLGGPLTLLWFVGLVAPLQHFVSVPDRAAGAIAQGLRAVAVVALFWMVARAIDVVAAAAIRSAWIASRPGTRALLPIITRVGKVVVFGLAVVAILSAFGFPVASIIAGLGIGGLAFALAAQKTIENLFGAFSIGADQPFREGDFVKIEDFVGTVEAVGLRSTRIRTLDRTLITLPNGKLADMRVESFTARDRMRLALVVSLVYGTTQKQVRTVLEQLEATLRAHPKIWPDAVVVRFSTLGAASLDIEVMAWFQTSDWGEFQLIRQDVLLQFMGVVEQAGTSFAFPTQTVHLVTDGKRTHRDDGAAARNTMSS